MDKSTCFVYNCTIKRFLMEASGWSKLPGIRLIICKKLSLGPGGDYHWNQKDVRGPYWRIYWNNAPGTFVSSGGRRVEVTPDKIIALSPDTVYSTSAEKKADHFYIHCFADYPFSEIKGELFVLKNPDLIRQASALAGKANCHDADWRTQMELMLYINSVFLAIPDGRISVLHEHSPRIRKVLEMLRTNHRISNEKLAARINMSRNAFLFLFKKEMGTSPQEYSRQYRINEACVLLHHSDKTIDEVAAETGFCDRYHFSRVFRDIIGDSPGAFRNRKYPDK